MISGNGITISAKASWYVKVLFVKHSGSLSITAKVKKLDSKIKFFYASDGVGLIPQIDFGSFQLEISDIKIKEKKSVLSPFINSITSIFKGWISDLLTKQLKNDGSIKKGITEQINNSLTLNYPRAIPLDDMGLAISTYMSGEVQYFTNGMIFPIEGHTFNLATGYKKYEECAAINDPTDPNLVQNDIHISIGECTVKTAIDSLIESGFSTNIDMEGPLSVTALVSLTKWDQQSIGFTNGLMTLGVGIAIKGKLGDSYLNATANAMVELSMTKRFGSHKKSLPVPVKSRLLTQSKQLAYIQSSKEYAAQFSSVLQNALMATYDVKIKIAQLDNLAVDGIPES